MRQVDRRRYLLGDGKERRSGGTLAMVDGKKPGRKGTV